MNPSNSHTKQIGVLTFHQSDNYGALLQCYALIHTLKQLGYAPVIINRYKGFSDRDKSKGLKAALDYCKLRIESTMFGKNFIPFRDEHLHPKTDKVTSNLELSALCKKFDAVIAGSDQVWRPSYTGTLVYNYFLDFVPDKVKKIAYAASFGTDRFEENANIPKIKSLLKRFHAISVRENTGINICNSLFNVEAFHVLDPTLLLDESDYYDVFPDTSKRLDEKFVARYFLDPDTFKSRITDEILQRKKITKLRNISVAGNYSFSKPKFPLSDFVYPSVPAWLSELKNAEYVVTDSFHGLVFSIIFKKQFVCIANEKRGITRMYSLLEKLGLTGRLMMENKENKVIIPEEDIDYKQVYEKLIPERRKSIEFIINAVEDN